MKGTPRGWIIGAVLLAILVAAWIDGGEEPLRPIDRPIALPEGVR